MVTQVPIFREQAIDKLIQSQEEIKQNNKMKQKNFRLGQQVLLKKETFTPWKKGLEQKWEGPFEIAEVLSHSTYRLRNTWVYKLSPSMKIVLKHITIGCTNSLSSSLKIKYI